MRPSLLAAIFLLCVSITCPLEDEDFYENVDFAERMSQLKETCAEKGFIWFNKFFYEDYLKWSSRNYSFLLLFVVLDKQRCDNCEEAILEFTILAKSFRQAYGLSDQLFLGIVDYDQTPEIFYRLLVRSIPGVVLVTADHKLTSMEPVPQMNMQRLGLSAEAISDWLAAMADFHFKIVRPLDYKFVYKLVGAICTISLLLLFTWKLHKHIASFCSSSLIRLVAMVFCLLMVSGYMFNRIHNTPWFRVSERGLSVVSQDSNFQFACETYLIGAMYLGFGGCVIVVVEGGMGKNFKSKATVFAAILFAAFFYTFIISSFRFKIGVYPFSGLVKVEKYF